MVKGDPDMRIDFENKDEWVFFHASLRQSVKRKLYQKKQIEGVSLNELLAALLGIPQKRAQKMERRVILNKR
jgi:hypothetical protein